MTKIIENPFDSKRNAIESEIKASVTARLATRANGIFKDLPYAEEHKLQYNLAMWTGWLTAGVSFATACLAIAYVLGASVGTVLAWVIAIGLCGLFEVAKAELWKLQAKQYFRYRRIGVGTVVILVALHVASLGSSGFGAYILPLQFSAPHAPHHADTTKLKSIAQLEASIANLHALNAQLAPTLINAQGKKSGSTTKAIAANNMQIQALSTDKQILIQALAADKATHEEAVAQANTAHALRVATQQYASLAGALVFELIYLFCTIYQFLYLYRVYLDSTDTVEADTAIQELPAPTLLVDTLNVPTLTVTDTVEDTPHIAPPANTLPTSPTRRPIGFNPEPTDTVANEPMEIILQANERICKHCNNVFQYKHWNAKFCGDECRIANWEQANGKKVKKGAK